MEKIQDETRQAIREFLPRAITAALLSYGSFLEEQASCSATIEPKDFKAHHDACKVAVAHIELLIKLAAATHNGAGEDEC